MSTPSGDPTARPDVVDPDDPTGRLASYMAKTRTPLDVLALSTLWIVLVPPGDFGSAHHASTIALAVRVALSVVYAIDLAIRVFFARRHAAYLRKNLFSVVVVLFPPLRIIFSFRLVRSVFRRGNLITFLVAASALVLNGAIIVDLVERHAAGSNIHTLGQSVWWAVTTVSTVGYGDYYPVTAGGQVVASFIMAIGILTLAVVTAQVASSFVDQGARNQATAADSAPAPSPTAAEVQTADLDARLARIEALLSRSALGPPE
jgi:voltage-gated potassium channel